MTKQADCKNPFDMPCACIYFKTKYWTNSQSTVHSRSKCTKVEIIKIHFSFYLLRTSWDCTMININKEYLQTKQHEDPIQSGIVVLSSKFIINQSLNPKPLLFCFHHVNFIICTLLFLVWPIRVYHCLLMLKHWWFFIILIVKFYFVFHIIYKLNFILLTTLSARITNNFKDLENASNLVNNKYCLIYC